MSKETLALVICTYQRPEAILRLLRALEHQTRPPEEVLVVDGSEDDSTETAMKQLEPDAGHAGPRYLRVEPQDRGLTRQRNVGIARTSGSLVAFLDDDTIPEPSYFAEILACFDRHEDAVGIGGYVTGVEWTRAVASHRKSLETFRLDGWQRREDYRWRARRLLGLTDAMSPGCMPPSGHGRPQSFLPPDRRDHSVEFLLGAATTWRRSVTDQVEFSPFFDGYGLYEDLEFSTRARAHGSLVVCGAARLEHCHEPLGRPNAFRYGHMVARNGWYVWRQRWPQPGLLDRLRWWATSILRAGIRLVEPLFGRGGGAALLDAAGRFTGLTSLLFRRPTP